MINKNTILICNKYFEKEKLSVVEEWKIYGNGNKKKKLELVELQKKEIEENFLFFEN